MLVDHSTEQKIIRTTHEIDRRKGRTLLPPCTALPLFQLQRQTPTLDRTPQCGTRINITVYNTFSVMSKFENFRGTGRKTCVPCLSLLTECYMIMNYSLLQLRQSFRSTNSSTFTLIGLFSFWREVLFGTLHQET